MLSDDDAGDAEWGRGNVVVLDRLEPPACHSFLGKNRVGGGVDLFELGGADELLELHGDVRMVCCVQSKALRMVLSRRALSASACRTIVVSGSSAMSIAVTGFSCAWDSLRCAIFPFAGRDDPQRIVRQRPPERRSVGRVRLQAGSSSHSPSRRVSSFRGLPRRATTSTRNCLDFGWSSRLQKRVCWRGPAVTGRVPAPHRRWSAFFILGRDPRARSR